MALRGDAGGRRIWVKRVVGNDSRAAAGALAVEDHCGAVLQRADEVDVAGGAAGVVLCHRGEDGG